MNPYVRWLGWLVAQQLRAIADRLNPPPKPAPPKPFQLAIYCGLPDREGVVTLVTNSDGVVDVFAHPTPACPSGHSQRHLVEGDRFTCRFHPYVPPAPIAGLGHRIIH